MDRHALIRRIDEEFRVTGEQLWEDAPDCLVFRNPNSKKWFAILMDVDRRRLGLSGEGVTDVVNVKSDPLLIGSLLHNSGYLPAYHMNKRTWISIRLDDAAPREEEILDLLHLSYDLVDRKK